jgi:hypothetical protein
VATVAAIQDALATQIQTQLGTAVPELQVDGRLIPSPSPPAIDVYPSDPFQEPLAMGKGNNVVYLTVRARVGTSDNEGGQDLLLSMMDPQAATSVAQAIMSSRTLSGTVGRVNVTAGPSAFGVFTDAGGTGNLLGCTWTVQVIR